MSHLSSTRPGTVTSGLLVVVPATVAVAVSVAVGQTVAVTLGLAALGTYLLALGAFEGETDGTTVAGTVAVLVAAGLATLAVVVAVGVAARAAIDLPVGVDDLAETLALTLVPLLTVTATAGAVESGTETPSLARVRAPLLALSYLFGILGGTLVVVAGVDLGLSGVVGDVGGGVTGALTAFGRFERRNQITGIGARLAVAGVALLLWRVVRTRRLYVRTAAIARTLITTSVETDDERPASASSADDDSVVPVALGVVAVMVGLVVGVAVQAPPGATVAALDPRLAPLSGLVGVVVAPTVGAALAWMVVAEMVLVAVHPVLSWGVRFPWRRYRRRLVRAAAPAATAAAVVLGAPSLVATVRQTPAVHYVYVIPGGRLPAFDGGRVTLVETGIEGDGLTRASPVFREGLTALTDAVGPVVPVLGPVVIAVVVLFVGVVAARSVWAVLGRLTSGPVLAGWLLFGAAGSVALVGAGLWATLLGGVGGLLVWDLHGVRRRLDRRLDPAATTARAELVGVGATGAALAVGVGAALVGQRAIRVLRPALQSRPPWQLVLGLLGIVLGVSAGLVALALRTNR